VSDAGDGAALEEILMYSGNEPPVHDALQETRRASPADINAAVPEDGAFLAGVSETEETTAWRDELAAKLSDYRARRKPLPPRYPSLRLAFEPPPLRTADLGDLTGDSKSPDACGAISQDALALDPFCSSGTSLVEPGTAQPEAESPGPYTTLAAPEPFPHHAPQQAKILEFPRLTSAAPPMAINELAEPVSQRPRILDVPDVVPPPPALGGITIEPAQASAAEKRPGIDVPLQSAPLGRRLIAAIVDAIIVAAACAIAVAIFWKVAGFKPPKFQLLALAATIPGLFWAVYQHLLVVYAGTTPGLRVAKLELTCFNGKLANRRTRRWRVLASYLSGLSLGMGYAWVFLDEDRLCWHDRITHTYLAPKGSAPPSE
jgi:uncharacterized RDD family membrane protein YckC